MFENFNDFLFDYLLEARDDFKTVKKVFEIGGDGIVKKDLPELSRLNKIHDGIEKLYRTVNDGYGIELWANEEKGIGGKFNFAQTKYLFANDNGIYEEGDDEDLKYFRPLDYPTPESYVGFIIMPDEIYESLYYMSINDYELNNLDLDYEGYTQMALEARIFNHWQRVLLYYMNGEGIGSVETETFKTEMPKIFPDWTWENFIAKFESVRLSNKE